MLLSAMKYFQGYVYVHLTGYAPERFLNLCGNRDILIWNLKPCEDGYYFYISIKGFKRLKPILKKTKTRIHIIRKTGAPFVAHRYRKRSVFCFGILFFGLLIYYLSGFIWNIEVNGNSYLSEEVILDFLKEENSTFGTKKTDIICERLEENLRSKYSEVIWTSIKIYGTKMTVDIQENLLPEEEYTKVDDTVYDIVAAKDGTVYQMVTRNGTPAVAAGTQVKAGDTLVSGRIDILTDDGEVGQYLYHSADADIVAKVTYPYQDVIHADYVEKVTTGNKKTDYRLKLFNIALKNPFFRLDFSDYNTITDTRQLHFTDNFYLPIYFVKETYEEYTNVEKRYVEDEIKQIASKHLNQYLSELEEKGIQIIEKNVMIERTNQKYTVSGTIEAYESIVSYRPTEITHITSEEGQNTDESD